MLSLSSYTIVFDKSPDFLRVALLIYTCSIALVLHSAFGLFLKGIVIALLLSQMVRIFRNPIPEPRYLTLSYHQAVWVLLDKQGQQLIYEKACVMINTGLFFLLELRAKKERKTIVVFSDQINKDVLRFLKIIEKTK